MTSGEGRRDKDLSMVHGAYTSRVLPRKVFNRIAQKVKIAEPKATDNIVGLKTYYITRIIANNLFFNPQALSFFQAMPK